MLNIKKRIELVLLVLATLTSTALAGDYYGGVDIATGKGSRELKSLGNTQNDDFTLTAFGIHGGYLLDMNSRVELSFGSQKFAFDNVNRDGTQFGVDYIYTFDEVSKLKPYIGVGLSINSLDIKLANSDTLDGNGLKLRVGSYYALTPQLDIGAELNYNFIQWSDIKFPDDSILESSSNFYGLGLNANYKF